MSLISAFAIYFLIWWTVLFMVLPFGVRTARESGAEAVPGQASSAPAAPQLLRKAVWTSVISAILFGLFWANQHYHIIGLRDLPGPFQQYLPPKQPGSQ